MSAPTTPRGTLTPQSNQGEYCTIAEAAGRLGVSRGMILRLVRARRLRVRRCGRRALLVRCDELQKLRRRQGRHDGRAPDLDWRDAGTTEHFVQFYEDDAVLIEAVAGFIGAGLHAGDASVVVATPAHQTRLRERLAGLGINLDAAIADGRYVPLDAEETLGQFMAGGGLDAERFYEVVGGVITRARQRGKAVRVFGEMVALLWQDGNREAAVRLEALWNTLGRRLPYALFCAYPLASLGGEAFTDLLEDVCAQHAHVIPAESYSALRDPDNRLRAIALLQQKAQSLQDALAAERAARAEAEAALRSRDEFLSIAAHELRTPLTVLRGQVELLTRRLSRDGSLDAERLAHALGVMDSGTEKLARLLSQLLDVSRLQAGRLMIEPCETDLAALARQVVAAARGASDRHTIRLTAPASLVAQVDPLRLDQVLTNLVENAIKYSGGGTIDVALRQDEGGVEISVQDQGPGIPPEQRGQIFERYFQAQPAQGDRGYRNGLGLGLYISREIVTQHGGSIAVDCPPEGGARFTVRIPSEPADDLATAISATDTADQPV